jgi:hypothetical protein
LKADQLEGYLPVDGPPEQMGITELRVHQVVWDLVLPSAGNGKGTLVQPAITDRN